MENIFKEIREEREKQELKWGEQNHPILIEKLVEWPSEAMTLEYEIPTEDRARELLEEATLNGCLSYMHILNEEISEAASCGENKEALRIELIQCAAVLVAMIESLDRNGR